MCGGCSSYRRLRVGGGAVAERAASELLTPVGGGPVRPIGSLWGETRRVDVLVHDVVMLLDLAEVDRVAEAGGLEQVARIRPQHRHLAELAPVALEVPVVDGIEPGQGRKQPHVGLGERVADQVSLRRQPVAEPVQPGEQSFICSVVRLLRSGEAAAVDAVVDLGVSPLANLIDFSAKFASGLTPRSTTASTA